MGNFNIAVYRKSHMVETSSYDGEIQAAFYGFDTARSLKRIVSDLLSGRGNFGV